ncbi:MAG TPA: kynureninase [Anaerolineales bacterium]|nr:kynureninase [Anaerolineales bacterium]
MTNFDSTRQYAQQLDETDSLTSYGEQFLINDPDLIYLDGNSLGRMPKAVRARMQKAVEDEWGTDLIRGWNKGWWEAPARIGEKIASLLGAANGQVIVSDQTSLNLYKLATAALTLRPDRKRIITDTFNFPSDLYILQGIVQALSPSLSGGPAGVLRKGARGEGNHKIIRIDAVDDDITPNIAALESAIDEDTALITLSHVTFKSGYLYDMQRITDLAHRKGALVLWDLSHSAGALPVELDKCNVDFAIGCTYKYLNGGPGAPAFLYVNRSLQKEAISPIWGWWGQNNPFAFDLDYQPAQGIQRFLTGTAPMLSMIAMEEALTPLLEAGMDSLRSKSVLMTDYASYLTDHLLAPLGFTLGSPRDSAKRGSHISIRHAEGYRINRALIDEMNVIPDFREPDNIRLGFAPLYISFTDVWEGFDRIRKVIEEKRYEKYPKQRLMVT